MLNRLKVGTIKPLKMSIAFKLICAQPKDSQTAVTYDI